MRVLDRTLLFIVVGLFFTLTALVTPANAQGWSNGYANRRALTIFHSQVPNSDQTNFPLLFTGTYSYLATTANGGQVTNANGYDIIFTSDSAGTIPLPNERESYNPSTGAVNFWIQIPTLSHTVDTVIYIFYGKSSVTTDQSNKTAVWDGNYKGVWHSEENSGNLNDSTSNNNPATPSSLTQGVSGEIGAAAAYNGSSSHAAVGNLSLFNPTTISVSAWVNATSYPNSYNYIVSKEQSADPYFGNDLRVDSGNLRFYISTGGAGSYVGANATQPSTGVWHYVVGTFDGSNVRLFIDGAQASSVARTGSMDTANAALWIGGSASFSGRSWNGSIEEVRLSSIARSADWIAAEYNNQSAPFNFYDEGSPKITGLSSSSAHWGDSLTITGKDFGASQGSSTVTVGGTSATITSWSATSVTVAVPVGAVSGNVVVTVSGLASNGYNLNIFPTGWSDQDIGNVGVAGSATYSGSSGRFTVNGAGAGIGSTADNFNFAYQSLSANGSIVARLVSLQSSSNYEEAGVMIRETLTSGSTMAFMGFTPTNGGPIHFRYRTTTGGSASLTNGSDVSLPYWFMVTRSGNTFTAYTSPDCVNWTQVGSSQTISMASNVYIGLAVTGAYTSTLATAVFDNVSINSTASPAPVITGTSATTGSIGSQVVITGTGFGTTQSGSFVFLNNQPMTIDSWSSTSITITIPTGATTGYLSVCVAPSMNNSNPVDFEVTTQPLPSSWLDQDIGNVGVVGSATYNGSSGTFTVKGAGSQIGGTADSIHFVYQPLSGDGTIVARLASFQQGASNYAEAGVMIRETLTPGATMAFMGFTPSNGGPSLFKYRTTTGGGATTTNGSDVSLPYWFMLIRGGNTFKAYVGPDGVNWTQVGSTQTINMATSVYIGLAVTSESTTNVATAAFDNVAVSPTAAFITPVLSSLSPPNAPVGGTVILTGTDFGSSQSSSHVSFNGVAPTINSWSSTSITATVPSTATSGPVTVTVAGVTSNSVQFTLIEAATVSVLSPNTGPLGTAVTITGTGFGAVQSDSTAYFSGVQATVINSWSDTQIVAVVPPYTGTGPVSVTVAGIIVGGPTFTLSRLTQLTDSLGNVSNYSASVLGGEWKPTAEDGTGCSSCSSRGVINSTYDGNGNVLTRTDPLGNTTTYTYDSSNNLLSESVQLDSTHTATTSYTYNSFGEVLTVTDALGNVTTNTYDSHGNLLTVTSPKPNSSTAASLTQFAYNSLGELTTITDPLSHVTTMTYTTAGLIATITDAQNNVTTYGYDAKGNRTSVTDALNHTTTFAYDAMSRLTTITYPDTTTSSFTYDIRGRRTSATDQNGKTTSYAYDDADRLTSVTDAASHVTYYAYDTESNLTSITDANSNQTAFTYDAFGRVTQTNFPSSLSEYYQYDANNNLTQKTDRKGQIITYLYDALSRLTQKTYPDTTTVEYTYDLAGKILQVNDPTGTYAYAYDNMGRLIGTTTSYSSLTSRNFTNAYTYDAASNRTGFTDPESGSTAYSYDTLNRLTSLAPPSAFGSGSFGFSYDALSRRTQMTRPNSVTTNYAYDNLSRLTSVLHQVSGSTIDGASYTLDSAGNRTAKTDQLAAVTSNYAYDAIYQLTQVTQANNTTESYSYDAVGNRTASLGVSSYTTNASNEMTANSNASYTYDSNGNTLTKTVGSNTTSYAWDFENRLINVTLPGSGGTVTFKYDPFGRRIEKVSPTFTSIFAYDGDNLIETVNSSGSVVSRYAQTENVDEPLAEDRSGTTSYYEAEGLGSISSLTNSAGALVNTYTYDSYGNLTASSGSISNPFQYAGREFDSETGLYYDRARHYDSGVGQFLSEDPVRFDAGVDFYSYAWNNPTNWTDPTGLSPCLDINAFVKELNTNASDASTGSCAKYVRWALEAGGIDTDGHPGSAKNYGPFLQTQGFSQVPTSGYTPQAGDIVVIQPYVGGNQAGHIEGWNGSQWVSDFVQPYDPKATGGGVYPGPGYRRNQPPYSIYRPTPCPISPAEQTIVQGTIKWIRSIQER